MNIPFVDLKTQYHALQTTMQARINAVLEHGQYIMGPEVYELEAKLAAYTGAKHCISVASGTEALLIALMALGIKPGDEIITTAFTFVATAEVIVLLGAVPVFVDIQADTCNLNPALLKAAITTKTKAILPVSLYGQPADMAEINAIAADYGLPVIEDAAQSFGAEYQGNKSCNLSTVGCTSFFPSKPLGCYGDGGAIFTSDDALATAMREIRVHGQERRYYHTRVGVGGRMDTLQCAIVLAKLERFAWEIEQRITIGSRYHVLLEQANIPLGLLAMRQDRTCVWAQYTIFSACREALRDYLQGQGIPTAVHYPIPLHQQPAYSAYGRAGNLALSERVASQVLSLPMSADLSLSQQQHIVSALQQFFRQEKVAI